MSLKLVCLLAIITLCAIVFVTEARDGRDQRDSFAKQAVDEKFARRRSSRRKSTHKITSSLSSSRRQNRHDTGHNINSNSSPGLWGRQNTDRVNHISQTTFNEQSQHNSHNWYPLSSNAAYHGTLTASPYVSHNWPSRYTSIDDSSAYDVGYHLGRSLTRNRNHHYHHYHNEQQPQTSTIIVENQMNPTDKDLPADQANYRPTASEVALAPLNYTLIPNGVSPPIKPIFRNSAFARSFKLPTITAAPPETPSTDDYMLPQGVKLKDKVDFIVKDIGAESLESSTDTEPNVGETNFHLLFSNLLRPTT